MINLYPIKKKKLIVFSVLLSLTLLGCDKEDDSKKHLEKGAEYINKGEYDKAKLEIKSATQSGKQTAETYYSMSLLNEKDRQFREMKENLQKTVDLAPTFTEARLKLGKVQLLFGEEASAMEQADFILKDSAQDLEALSLKASVLIRQKKNEDALAIINNILKINPNHSDALSLKAVIYMEKNDFTQALALIDEAKKSDTKNMGLDFFTIQLHAKAKNIDAVIADYQALIAAHPEERDFKITLAKIYVQAGKPKEAEALLRGLIDGDPNKTDNQLLLLDFLSATAKEKVSEQYHQFLEVHKDQARQLLGLANWMIARRNFEEAKVALNQVIELEKNSIVGLSAKTFLAKIAFDTKNFEGSKKIVEEILEANSSYDDAKVLQARLLLIEEKYDEAIAVLNKVVWSKEDSEEANLLLAQTFVIKGDQKQADKHFLAVLSVNPANIQAVTYMYDKALQAKEIRSAKDLVTKALTIRPDNIVLLEKQANINLTENDWDSAKVTSQKIASLPNPFANDVASYILAQVHQGQGDCAKAIEIYKELLTKFPENSNALGNMARCYEKLNKRSEMIVFLDSLMANNSQNIAVGMLLGDLYLMDKKVDKGQLLLANLINNNDKIPQLYILLANMKLAINDNKAAIAVYQDGLKKNPNNAKLILSLASLYEEIGDYDSAVSLYEDLISKDPNLDVATNSLAVLLSEHYSSAEKLNEAVQLTEKFKKSVQPYYKDTHAWTLIKIGRFAEGLQLLNEVITSAPDIPVFKYHLGVAYYKNGNNSLAINELKQAIELGDKNKYFAEKKSAEILLQEIVSKTRGH